MHAIENNQINSVEKLIDLILFLVFFFRVFFLCCWFICCFSTVFRAIVKLYVCLWQKQKLPFS